MRLFIDCAIFVLLSAIFVIVFCVLGPLFDQVFSK